MQCSPTSVRTPLNFKFTDSSNRPRDILVRRFALCSVHIVGRLQWKSKNLRLVWSSFPHLLSNFDPLGKMGKPLVYEIWQKPATSCIIGVCSAIWFYIQKKNIGYANVGLSYDTAVEGHYWRLITSAFSHISVLHLVFNMSALWSLGVIEQLGHMGLGVEFYLQYTLVLVILSGLLVLGSYHVLIQKFKLEYLRRVTAVGYSAVVFGWMTILSVKQPSSKLNLFGVLSLPISFAPFESLIFTSIIVPQASFVGHLSGIIVGYSIAWGLIHGMSNYWAISMLGWTILVFVLSLKRSGAFDFSFIEIELVQDLSLPTVSPFAPGNGRTLQMDALPV